MTSYNEIMSTLKATQWQDKANCLDCDPELFFAEDETRQSRARTAKEKEAIEVCKLCPVSGNCLDAALSWPDTMGVWGGTTTQERAKILRIGRRATCVRCGGKGIAPLDGAGQACLTCGLSWRAQS